MRLHIAKGRFFKKGAKRDGTGKNFIVPRYPFCGKSGGKFGIYIGPETARREPLYYLHSKYGSCGSTEG